MPSNRMILLSTSLVLGGAALIFAAVAIARTHGLSLPLPASLPVLNFFIPVVAAIAWPLSRNLSQQIKGRLTKIAFRYLASATTLAPFALLVLSLVYAVPSDVQRCAADQHWLTMFEHKDARAIRTIQSSLQCCGLNSMHDRAWPFPSREVDARSCERTQGYNRACGDIWRHQETIAAVLTVVASILNWAMVTLIVTGLPVDEGRVRLPAWSNRPTHLIEGTEASEEEAADEQVQSRVTPSNG